MEKFELISFFSMGALYLINEIRKWYSETRSKKKKRQQKIEDAVRLDSEIYKVLWHLQGKFSCLRVYITQFHNGETFYTGQSIQRHTVSHEVTAQGKQVQPIKLNYGNVLISERLHMILVHLIRHSIFRIDDVSSLKNSNDEDVYWFETYGVKSFVYFKINDTKNRLIAVLNIHWDVVNPVTSRDVSYIIETKKRLETIFNSIE